MPPKHRKPGRQNWPANLHAHTDSKTGRVYYSYRHPDTGKRHGMGTDKHAAMAAARELNNRLQGESPLVAQVMSDMTITRAIPLFERDYLADRELAEKTRYLYAITARKFARSVPDRSVRSTTVKVLADFLDTLPNRASNLYRNTLIHFYRFCCAKGWIDWNPAEATLKKQETVKRQRLTLAQYQQIWFKASLPIRDAMDLSLKTLQARAEISAMKFEHYNRTTRKLRIIRRKTHKASLARMQRGLPASAFIEILADDELHELIERCRNDVVSAYMVHHTRKKSDVRGRGLSPEALSRGFQSAREKAGIFSDLLPEQRPTFHEIRALGAHLLRKKGVSETVIQQLLGHTSKAMTWKYLEGHEVPYVEVSL